MTPVSETFARVGWMSKGYDIEQVETFLSKARTAYEDTSRSGSMTSWHVRTVGFDLVRGGYDSTALEQLIDAHFNALEGSHAP